MFQDSNYIALSNEDTESLNQNLLPIHGLQ